MDNAKTRAGPPVRSALAGRCTDGFPADLRRFSYHRNNTWAMMGTKRDKLLSTPMFFGSGRNEIQHCEGSSEVNSTNWTCEILKSLLPD